MASDDVAQLFVSIGLSEAKAKETLKNTAVSAHLKSCIDIVSSQDKLIGSTQLSLPLNDWQFLKSQPLNLYAFQQGSQHTNNGVSKAHGMLLYHIATKIKAQISGHLALLTKYVVEGKIDSELRLNGNLFKC